MAANNIKQERIWDTCLSEYNKIRRKYGLPNILGDLTIHAEAQKHADYLATENKFETTTLGNKYATNIATSVEARVHDAIKDSIERLNKNEGKRFYLKEGCNKMGIGVARNEIQKKWVIVMFYEMPQLQSLSKPQGTKTLRNMFSAA